MQTFSLEYIHIVLHEKQENVDDFVLSVQYIKFIRSMLRLRNNMKQKREKSD